MKHFALHDVDGNVRRVVGLPAGQKPDARDLLATEVPDSRYRVRPVDSGGFEPYLPDAEDAAPSRERARLRRRIAALDKESISPLRELAIDPSNVDARLRLADIDAEIAELRKGPSKG